MYLRVDDSIIYDTKYRENVLKGFTKALKGDKRVIGAILVGSGAIGFNDRYSDLDIAILINDETQIEKIYTDWWETVPKLFPVIEAFKEPPKHVLGFLLDRFLELDISFQGKTELFERRPNWKILFDRKGVIPGLMVKRTKPPTDEQASQEKRMRDSWYYITHAIISIQRNQLFKALFFIQYLRDETILMAGLSRGMATSTLSYNRETDLLPLDVKTKLIDTYPNRIESTELLRVLKSVVGVYHEQAEIVDKEFGLSRASKIKSDMSRYLSAFSS
jgi:predicted nucleotidyltransferase